MTSMCPDTTLVEDGFKRAVQREALQPVRVRNRLGQHDMRDACVDELEVRQVPGRCTLNRIVPGMHLLQVCAVREVPERRTKSP